MRVKRKFKFEGIELKIVEREEHYLNSEDTILATRVIAPNGGTLPLQIQRKQTLKSIIEDSVNMLTDFKKRGANIKEELTKQI